MKRLPCGTHFCFYQLVSCGAIWSRSSDKETSWFKIPSTFRTDFNCTEEGQTRRRLGVPFPTVDTNLGHIV